MSVPRLQLLCLPDPLMPGEGLFVEQHAEVVAARHLGHHRHEQLVVVVGRLVSSKTGASSNWLGPPRCGVSCRDAELVAFYLEVEHECLHARRYCTEIVILELLVWPIHAP